jgi:glycosyltransferase involved in cell wall biosynthesis
MGDIKVSIIMPAHNQEKYIGDAINSVLSQTYSNWELVIVDDGSVDDTAKVISNYTDLRIRYIHRPNKGVCEARNLGISEAKGELVAFLDADDLFHPDKLRAQVDFLNAHPDIGLVFVSRIEMDQNGNYLNFYSHPDEITLSSVVLGFPFAPSELVVRRHWIRKVGGFDHSFVINEDREWYIRLILAGCRCQGVQRFLSYRRLDNQKIFKDLPGRLEDMRNALESAFRDSSCPAETLALREKVNLNIYLAWAYQAASQGEIDLFKEYLEHAIIHAPSLLMGDAEEWTQFMLHASIRDGGDHEKRLRSIFSQLPTEASHMRMHLDRLISRGYLIRGMREAIWGRYANADIYLKRSTLAGADLDLEISSIFTDMLMNYEIAYGVVATEKILIKLLDILREVFSKRKVKLFVSIYSINQAFKAYNGGHFSRVIRKTIFALTQNPSFVFNRGVLSILFRSILRGIVGLFNAARLFSAKVIIAP